MLKSEDRLTIPHAGHERKHTQYGYTAYWTQASKFAMMNRLGQYEDLGYTPEEIKEMLQMVKELDRAVDELGSCLEDMKS